MRNNHQKIGRFLSFVLRHKPEAIGLVLDQHGWVETELLLQKMDEHGQKIDLETLRFIVKTNDKQRFAFSEDGTKIRANQGHSINIDLGYEEKKPPKYLYHGTAHRFIADIFREGIKKQSRDYVHLSCDIQTALLVGKRHGKPVVLQINSGAMEQEGFIFYQSDNGVWLTDHVPSRFISVEK